MYKTEEKNLFDFINENNTPEIKVNSMVKKINEINEINETNETACSGAAK